MTLYIATTADTGWCPASIPMIGRTERKPGFVPNAAG